MLEDKMMIDRDALSNLRSIIVAIGNYNNATKKQLDVLIAKLGNVFKLGKEKKPYPKSDENNQRKGYESNDKNSKKPKFEDKQLKPGYRGCGRKHDGKCNLEGHPNFNRSNLPWADSEMGKAFRELKGGQRFDKLPDNRQLNYLSHDSLIYI